MQVILKKLMPNNDNFIYISLQKVVEMPVIFKELEIILNTSPLETISIPIKHINYSLTTGSYIAHLPDELLNNEQNTDNFEYTLKIFAYNGFSAVRTQ